MVVHLLSRQGDDSECPCCANLGFSFLPVVGQFTIKCCLCGVSSSRCCVGRGHTHVQGPAASWNSSGGKKIAAGLDCVAVSPLGSVVMPGLQSFNSPKTAWTQAWCPRVAWRCCRFLRVQVVGPGRNHASGTEACPGPVAKPFLDVGDVIVGSGNTSCECAKVVEPLVRDMRVAQVLNPRHLLPGNRGEERLLQTPQSTPVR